MTDRHRNPSKITVRPDPYYPDYPEDARMYRLVPDPNRPGGGRGRPRTYTEPNVYYQLVDVHRFCTPQEVEAMIVLADAYRDTADYQDEKDAVAAARARRVRAAALKRLPPGHVPMTRELLRAGRKEKERREQEASERGVGEAKRVDFQVLFEEFKRKHGISD